MSDQYFELSNKNDPSERYGLPDDVWVRGGLPTAESWSRRRHPSTRGSGRHGVYYHDVPA